MKYIVGLSMLVCVAFAKKIPPPLVDSWNDFIGKVADVCIQETLSESETIKTMLTQNEFPVEESMHCFFKCLYEKYDIMLPNGEMVKDMMVKLIDHVTSEIANTCVDQAQSETSSCKKAHKIAACIVKVNLVD
ncbi:hypothetical protein FQR65_LT18895 [Abscondita terminalis]|nr:hypothetical protein FQR65_LT18895 [Abscondita terminalis]